MGFDSRSGRLLWSIAAMLLALTAGPAPGQEADFRSSTEAQLTVRDAVSRALAVNYGLQAQARTQAIAEDAIEIARAGFDPAFEVTGFRSVSQEAQAASDLDGSPGPRSEVENVRAGVTRRIPTGGTFGVSTLLNRRETNSAFARLNPAYNSDVTLSANQPLLRGFGPRVVLADIRRSEIGIDRARIEFLARVLDMVRDTELAYFRLLSAREQLGVRRMGLALAEKLLEENQVRRATGVATDLDVLTAEVGVANQRRQILQAEQLVGDREDALWELIGQFEMDSPLNLTPLPPAPPVTVQFQSSFDRARDHHPEYRSLLASIEQLRIDADVAQRQKRPTLNLGMALGYSAREETLRSSVNRVPDGDSYAWQVNLTLRYPWGFREENARVRQTQSSLFREELRLRALEQNLLIQIRAAVRSVQTNAESVTISSLTTRLSERQYDLEKARFDAGLSTSRRVLDAQDDLDNARLNELQARIALREAVTNLHRLEGSSLEELGLDLPVYDFAVRR